MKNIAEIPIFGKDTRRLIDDLRFKAVPMQQDMETMINAVHSTDVSVIFSADKSIRPAMYLFQTIWTGLQAKGILTRQDTLPQIRFLDPEKNNWLFHKDKDEAMRLAKNKYRIPAQGRILVADEFTDSGGSMQNAGMLVRNLFPKREILYHRIFRRLPPWYAQNAVTGVQDATPGTTENNRLWTMPMGQLRLLTIHKGSQSTVIDCVKEYRLILDELIVRPTIRGFISGSLSLRDQMPTVVQGSKNPPTNVLNALQLHNEVILR